MTIEADLLTHLKKFSTAPFLFIGSGFSERYLGTENQEGLMRLFSELVPKSFDYYRSTANSKWESVAELIADDFHEIWWNDDLYKESRSKYSEKASDKHSPLKIEIANYFLEKKYQSGIDKHLDEELVAFRNVVIDGIITTNWDTFIEDTFQEMKVYKGKKELLFSNTLEINEIYKLHGCSTNPDSLVLTESDYSEFNSRNAYLAAKLLPIFIEHPIIFIGYSLSDPNIIGILESITDCLDESNIDKLKDRLIFVTRANGSEETFQESTITVNGITLPITRIQTDDFRKVYNPLGKTKRKFSTKVLGQMKSQMYELIKHNDPKGKIQVVDYDINKESAEEDIEFVVGFGIDHFAKQVQGIIKEDDFSKPSKLSRSFKGYKTHSREDLLSEIIADEDKFSYDYDELLLDTLPEKLKTDRYIPVNRFVKFSSIGDDPNLDHKIITSRNLEYEDFLSDTQKEIRKGLSFNWQFTKIEEVLEGYEQLGDQLFYTAVLGPEKINKDTLRNLLVEHLDKVNDKGKVGINLRRLFRIYDYLAFGKDA